LKLLRAALAALCRVPLFAAALELNSFHKTALRIVACRFNLVADHCRIHHDAPLGQSAFDGVAANRFTDGC
jgi:hypothetical protein